MATPPKSWFPWLRFQRAVGEWVQGALGFTDTDRAVVWADFNVERPPLPYLGLQVISGPTRRAVDSEMWPRLHPATIVVTITPNAVADVGDITNLIVNGELFTYVAKAGDTVTTVRDAILAQLAPTATLQLMVTAVAVGGNQIRLTANEPASMVVTTALGCTATTTATTLAALTVGAREIRVRMTAYGEAEPTAPGEVGVAEWIELVAEAMNDSALRSALANKGFVVTRAQVLQQRATSLSGADREPRSAADFIFACNVRRGRVVTTWLDEAQVNVPVPVEPSP